MKHKTLKTFLKLAESNCDFGVHKILGIPRSTLWAHVSELENELKIKLVERRKQNSTLTEEGKLFIPYAMKMVRLFEEIGERTAPSYESGIDGNLLISMTHAVSHSWFVESIRDFSHKYPNLRLHILSDNTITRQTENAADILVRPMGNNPNFRKLWYISYKHGLFASKDYLDSHGVPKTPEDLLDHKLLGYGEHEFTNFEDVNWHLKGQWGLPKLTPTLAINSTTALYSAACEGVGIASVALESLSFYGKNLVRILPQIDGPEARTYFAVRESASPAAMRTMDVFRVYFEEYLIRLGIKIHYIPAA
jgi:DNA-binding transcriptional LysR family regulator